VMMPVASGFTPDDGMLLIRNRVMMENNELSIGKNCICCFKQIVKKSREHPIPESIAETLVFTDLICNECNQNLGSVVDFHWTWDCWMRFAKDQLGLQKFNFKSKLKINELQNRYILKKLPNGKTQLEYPFTQTEAWRAVTKMAYELAAIAIGNCIFRRDFDGVRCFILTGKLSVNQSFDPGFINLGEWCNIVRTSFGKEPEPRHIFLFEDVGDALSIHKELFRSYSFFATFKINRKDKRLEKIKYPFLLVQQLSPDNKFSTYSWNIEQRKWETIDNFYRVVYQKPFGILINE
jgi:hypothetical protein